MRYVGRFAPSPTGPLHAGSLVAALGSWLDTRAHGGRWLVRIEDVDTPRCMPGAAEEILRQLAGCGLVADEAPLWQSTREAAYRSALDALRARGLAYPCGCSRSEIDEALAAAGRPPRPGDERPYPGTCRGGLNGKPMRSLRLRTDAPPDPSANGEIRWQDRRLGMQRQRLEDEVGDFILHRADGIRAYQLAVVVDDAFQRVTDVVRGEDLADNTARQIHLQHCLGLPTPAYLHLPLVRNAAGQKLSKQTFAEAVRPGAGALRSAMAVLGLAAAAEGDGSAAALLGRAVAAWGDRYAKSR